MMQRPLDRFRTGVMSSAARRRHSTEAQDEPPGTQQTRYGVYVYRVETGFYMRAKVLSPLGLGLHGIDSKTRSFAKRLTRRHNQQAQRTEGMKTMESTFDEGRVVDKHYHWTVERADTIQTDEAPWGIKINSPIMPIASWRQTVNNTWRFLDQNYVISGGPNSTEQSEGNCGTYVHLTKANGMFSPRDVKRIAQAWIWWEPAFEALLPSDLRPNAYTKSNYMDNRQFARASEKKTRKDSIDVLEGQWSMQRILNSVQPDETKYWGINFNNLRERPQTGTSALGEQHDPFTADKTIEMRRFGVCKTKRDVFMCIEAAAAFMTAAMQSDRERFTSTYRNPGNVRDLMGFILSAGAPFSEEDIRRLFAGKEDRATLAPVPLEILGGQTPLHEMEKTELKWLNGHRG